MPVLFRPLRPAVTSSFDKENVRTMAALKAYAESEQGRNAGQAQQPPLP